MDAAPPQRRPRLPPPDAEAEVSLESLPPELLNGILSRLTLRDAARTAALARAWRCLWESVPFLKFKWGEGADPAAITDVLRRYSCPVIEFQNWRIEEDWIVHAKRWVLLLSRKKVQALVLHFRRTRELVHTLSRAIFSCRELTVLDLCHCNIQAMPPGFTGFPHLTILNMSCVGFPEGPTQLEFLVSTSPSLEKLYIELLRVPYSYSHDMSNQWVIRAPKLRKLAICDGFDHGWQISDLPSLEVARIECTSDHDFDKLITGVAYARDLEINIPDGNGYVLEGLSRPFNDLKRLLLRTSLSLLSRVLSVFCLLKNAPKLESLYIEIDDSYSWNDEVESDLLNEQWTDGLFAHPIRVDMRNMMCKLSEMHFVEFVLSKARQLQEFHVCFEESCPKSNEDAITELVKYRSFSSCQGLLPAHVG